MITKLRVFLLLKVWIGSVPFSSYKSKKRFNIDFEENKKLIS